MNRKYSSLLLLLILSITDAYLLAHPNLIGRLGVLLYKHTYIRNFPRALLTVMLTVGISVLVSELIFRLMKRGSALALLGLLQLVAVGWFVYVYITFSTFAYGMTGKAFIYGAHLLPVILTAIFGRYLIKRFLLRKLPERLEDVKK